MNIFSFPPRGEIPPLINSVAVSETIKTLYPFSLKVFSIKLSIVLLPEQGPPVITIFFIVFIFFPPI